MRYQRLLIVTASLLTLTACQPNALPKGYVYHGEAYKSPNPPQSKKITPEQRAVMGPQQADQFRLAVYDLADKLTKRAGMPPKAVFVHKPEPMTPFYASLDNDLRESLRHIGYQLADKPEDAYVFTYKATVLTDGKTPDVPGKPNVRIGLYVFDKKGEDGRMLTQEVGDYYIAGAGAMNIPFATFPGTFIPEPTGPGSFRE
jgi:hypothetical protein